MDQSVRQIVLSDVALQHKAHDCLRFSPRDALALASVGDPIMCVATLCRGAFAKKADAKIQLYFELCKFSQRKNTFLPNYLHFPFVFSIFACQNVAQNNNET